MTYVPLTRASTIVTTVNFLRRAGASVDRVLAMADMPRWIASDSEMLVPSQSSTRLRGVAARVLAMPNFGLNLGEQTGVEGLGLFGTLLRRAPTLGAMLQTTVQYTPMLTSRERIRLRVAGDTVQLARALAPALDPRDFTSQQTDHFILGLLIGLVRLAAGASWRPAEVHLQTDEAPGLRDAASLAGARIAFRQPETMVVVPHALLATRLPPVAPTEIPGDVQDWISSAPARDFAASIRQAVETLSRGENYPSVRQTADFVGMSVRTLQRRLAQAGASHHMLVAQARFGTAAAVLERTDHRILDLALDLGYSDHANFTRAFRRWAGCAPREYQSRNAPPAGRVFAAGGRGGGQAASATDPPIWSVSSRTHAARNDKENARSKVA